MEHARELILLGSFLILLSVFAGQLSTRLGAPVLLAFLGVGVFFGEDGPGGIVFNDKSTAFLICSVCLAIVLFDGGLRTHIKVFKRSLKPALALSTIGVLITAVIVGLFTSYLLHLPLLQGMLVGAIIASTDAAAVFLLLHQRGIHLKEHVSATLEIESSINDPMALFLTLTCVNLLTLSGTDGGWLEILGLFIKQMGLGAVIGYAGGVWMTHLLRLVKLDVGLYPVVILASGLFVYAGTDAVGGSGFLAVYISGVAFANSGFPKMTLIKQFNDGVAWIAQLVMLLTLGLLVTPSTLGGYAFPALMIAIILTLVARPLAVWLCLGFSAYDWREKTFISWVGLRGAIPIYLALVPALSQVENGQDYFNIAFMIVVISLMLQGWTINPLARRLGLVEPPKPKAEKP